MQENDYYDGMRRVLRLTSIVSPVLAFCAALIQIVIHKFSINFVSAEVIVFFGTCYMARFLYKRSKNEEAVFFLTRIKPSDSQSFEFLGDGIFIAVELGFLLLAIFLPIFIKG